ncbi:hypothetical protein HK097_003196, partial [Rhizophlyctis rosea]
MTGPMTGSTSTTDDLVESDPLKPPDSTSNLVNHNSSTENIYTNGHHIPAADEIGGIGISLRGASFDQYHHLEDPESPSTDNESFRVEEEEEHLHGQSRSSRKEKKGKKKKGKKKNRFTLASSNFVSQLLFLWVCRLVSRVRRAEDIRDVSLHLKSAETAKVTGEGLERTWNQEVAEKGECVFFASSGLFSLKNVLTTYNRKASLLHALFRAFGLRYFLLAIWKLLWAIFTWFGAYWLLHWIILYSSNRDSGNPQPAWQGYLLALALFLSAVLSALCFHQLTIQCTRIGIQCRAALMVLIYRKSLKLSYVKGGVGDIVNLISNECNRIAEAAVNCHFLWSAGLECLIVIILACIHVGISALPAVILILGIVLPLQYILARKASAISYKTTASITRRVYLMSEILTAIKLIKFYAWEGPYREKVRKARELEVSQMKGVLRMKIANFT